MKNKNVVKEIFLDIIFCAGGCILYSAAVHIFATPNDIAQGGIIGIAMLVNHIFPLISTGTASFILNFPLFLLAWKFIGGKFILKSFMVTVFLSFTIDFISFLPVYKGDRLLAALFCGVISGFALALIFLRGVTSGGTDILAKLIRLKFSHIPMGRVILVADFFVVVTAGFVYRNIESAMYSLILIFVSTYFIDYVLYGASDAKALLIVTKNYQKIAIEIMKAFHRGVTVLPVEGGYTGEQKKMLVCAMKKNEVSKLLKVIRSVDKNAFTIVCNSSEISGLGFRNGNEN